MTADPATEPMDEVTPSSPAGQLLTPAAAEVHPLYRKLRVEVSGKVRELYDRWEGRTPPRRDYEVQAGVGSLESAVGYTSPYRQMSRNLISTVAYCRSLEGGPISPEKAWAVAYQKCTNGDEALEKLNELLRAPLQDLSFLDLLELHEQAPRVAEEFWEHAKREGQREFESGHAAANAVLPIEYERKLWNAAKYLGVRESFVEEWMPAGGIELSLVDVLAQAYFQFQYWTEQTVLRAQGKPRYHSNAYSKWVSEQKETYGGQGRWDPGDWHLPALSEKESIEHAAQMADRFHKMYTRTLKQMREHRRYSPVVINKAEQVNIAADGGQQINVSKTD